MSQYVYIVVVVVVVVVVVDVVVVKLTRYRYVMVTSQLRRELKSARRRNVQTFLPNRSRDLALP